MNDDFLKVLFIGGVLVLGAATIWISRLTGAGLAVVLEALLYSAIAVSTVLLSVYVFPTSLGVRLVVSLAFIYPIWWPVLDSIAAQSVPMFLLQGEDARDALPWWRSTWFNWTTEFLLVAVVYRAIHTNRYY